MAGESPGKSEQRTSSGTAPEERDPRLSMFRESTGPSDGTNTASDDADGTEGAEAEDAPGRASGSGTDAAAADPDEQATEAPERPAEPSEADSASSGASGAPEAPVSVPAAEADGEGDATDSEADGGSGEAEASEASEASETAETSETAEVSGASGASGADDASGAVEASEAAERPEDGRLRAAVAAWVGKPGTTDEPEKPAASEQPDAADEAEPTAADEAEPTAADEPAAEKSAPAEKSGATVPRSREEAAPTEPAAATAADETTDEDASGESGESEAADASEVSGEADASDASDPSDASDSSDASDEDATGIDQPTAVFKAVRRPRLDQPTTALKLPKRQELAKNDPKPDPEPTPAPAPKPDPEPTPAPAPKPKPEPESEAERTSTFVPLRSDDVRTPPAPRRPEPQGPVIGPTVTPALGTPTPGGTERTRQQPLPPKPPLDLLAELTNTPPPPETPVRTAVRRVKIWTPLVLLLLIIFAAVQMFRPLPDPALAVTATPTYTFEGATPDLSWPDQGQGYMAATGLGKVGSFGEQKPVPIASVAKAMTAYIVLKDHPMKKGEDGESIKVDAKGEADGKLDSEGESVLDTVKEGDVLTQRDALSAIMIPSANNIARLLARWDAGSENAFVEKMNATAKELGMTNTTYTDPSGLNATTVSTAEDLVKLGEKLVEIPALMEITVLPSWTDPSGKLWTNFNRLVPFNGALGIKTGSTTKAGGNLLFAAHKTVDGTDQLIVGAILAQYDSQSIIDEVNRVSKTVMLATEDALKGATVVKKGQVVGVVDDGLGGTTDVVVTKDVKAVGWGGLTVKLELTDDGRTIPHSAAAGTHVGTLTVGEGTSQVKVAVALAQDLSEPGIGAKLSRIG